MAKLIPIDEAAAQLGITPDELAEARSRGDVFGYRDGATWKFKEAELERFAATLDISPAAGESGGLPKIAPLDDELDQLVPVTDLELDDDDSQDPDSLLVSEQELGESDPVGGSTIIGKDELADDLKVDTGSSALSSAINLLDDDDDEITLESGDSLKLEKPGETLDGDSEIKLAADSKPKLSSSSEVNLEGSEIDLDGSELQLEGSSGSGLELAESASNLLSDADLMAASSGKLEGDDDDDLILDEGGLSGSAVSLDLDDDAIDLDGSGLDLDASGTGVNLLDASGSDITLDASSSGINLNPSDSGISLEASGDLGSGVEALELGEADEIVELGDEDIDLEGITELKTDDDFLLSPVDGELVEDEDSGSQVIALDAEEVVDFDESAPTMLGDDALAEVADFEELEAAPVTAEDAATPVAAVSATAGTATVPEAPFSIWNVLFLGLSVLLLCLCGIMVMDLLRNMWSWQEPYSLTSKLMDGILSLIGK